MDRLIAWTLVLAGLCTASLCTGCQGGRSDDYHVLRSDQTEPSAPPEAPSAPTSRPLTETSPPRPPEPTNAATPSSPETAPAPVTGELASPSEERQAPLADVSPGDATSRPDDDANPEPPAAKTAEQLRAEQMAAIRAQLARLSDPTGKAQLASTESREIKLLIPEKKFAAEGPSGALRITFDDLDLLKVLNMEPVPANAMDYLPDWLQQLNGQRVILRGWMYPPLKQSGITRFMFVRDNEICCFGRDPMVYDKLGTTMKSGKKTDYIQNRAFDVVATFRIEPDVDDGELMWLYHLDDAVVIDR